MKRFPHFPNIFLFLDGRKRRKNTGGGRSGEKKKEERKARVFLAGCWGSGEKWRITLWRTTAYSFPLILASRGKVGEVGEVV